MHCESYGKMYNTVVVVFFCSLFAILLALIIWIIHGSTRKTVGIGLKKKEEQWMSIKISKLSYE